MSYIEFNADQLRIRVDVRLEPGLRSGYSARSVFHLHRDGAHSTICGRVRVRALRYRGTSRAGTPYLWMCPYCIAAVQRIEKRGLRRV